MLVIKKGSSETEIIKAVQRVLGFTGDDVDGDFGNKTEKALIIWQQRNHIVADGFITSLVLEKMSLLDTDLYKKPSLSLFEKYHFHYMHESGLCMLIGIFITLFLRVVSPSVINK